MNTNRFMTDKTKGAVGQPQPDGRYIYYLGEQDGREIVVDSPKHQLCRWSLREFYQDALRQNKMDNFKQRLRAKLEAKKR